MFIGLMCNEDGYEEPFGDVTVNLSVAAPNYCGYLSVNDMPDIEKFITDNDLGEFTGFTQRSGFCEYPLYPVSYTHLDVYKRQFMDRFNEVCAVPFANYYNSNTVKAVAIALGIYAMAIVMYYTSQRNYKKTYTPRRPPSERP